MTTLSDLFNNFAPLQAATGTACNWQVTGGARVQAANAPQCFQIQSNGVFENLVVLAGLQSSDDDPMGILFRYLVRSSASCGRCGRLWERREATDCPGGGREHCEPLERAAEPGSGRLASEMLSGKTGSEPRASAEAGGTTT